MNALHAHLGKCLGPLLQKYGAHATPLRGVLGLLRQLRFGAAHSTLKGKRFDELLVHLEGATLKHSERSTLAACGATWSKLLEQSGAPALQEAVQSSPAAAFKKNLAKMQAGDYDEAEVQAKLNAYIAEPAVMFSFTT